MNKLSIIWVFLLGVSFRCTPHEAPKPASATRPNVLLICIDDLRPELASFDAPYINSPNIDRLAQQGVSFQKHYVNAPSCGPSRYTLLTGQYGPASNNALFQRSAKIAQGQPVDPSMPEWFRAQGYTTVAVGKVSHHPGGLGGADWNDTTQKEMPRAWDKQISFSGDWQHPRGLMHGLAGGQIRIDAAKMDVFQSAPGDDTIYPDGLITKQALNQLGALTANQQTPFFLAVGLIKPHLPFGAPQSYYDLYDQVEFPAIRHPRKPSGQTTWHDSGEFMKYNRWDMDPNQNESFALEVRKHYAACVSYMDAQVGKILQALKQSGADKNTIVVLWGDHGWHLGEHAIWGKHSLFEESLRSPLVIDYPQLKYRGTNRHTVVETLDIFPTICDLAGIQAPKFATGNSLRSVIENNDTTDASAISYMPGASTIRTASHRLILHNDGYVELYDHTSNALETANVAAEHPKLVEELTQELRSQLQ